MPLDLNAIHAALYARLAGTDGRNGGVPGLKFTSRNFYDFDRSGLVQPAMLVVAKHGAARRQSGVQSVWTMNAMVIFYVRAPSDDKASVEATIFGLIGSVDTALLRQANEAPANNDPGTTLGGKILRCWRSDYEVFHGAGEANGQAAVTMTIEMVAPDPA